MMTHFNPTKVLLAVSLIFIAPYFSQIRGHEDSSLSIGEQYIEFLTEFISPEYEQSTKKLNTLLAPTIKKIVNSNLICSTRDELIEQMQEVKMADKPYEITLLDYFITTDQKNIIRWEISYAEDNSTETVITILSVDENGKIAEINEVFGEKNTYEWQSHS